VNTQSIGKLVKKNLHTWELQLQGTEEPIQLSNLERKRLRALL
jgi:DNA-binding LytR/AlgR family response regulator